MAIGAGGGAGSAVGAGGTGGGAGGGPFAAGGASGTCGGTAGGICNVFEAAGCFARAAWAWPDLAGGDCPAFATIV